MGRVHNGESLSEGIDRVDLDQSSLITGRLSVVGNSSGLLVLTRIKRHVDEVRGVRVERFRVVNFYQFNLTQTRKVDLTKSDFNPSL